MMSNTGELNKFIANTLIFIAAVIIIHNIPVNWFGDAPNVQVSNYKLTFQDPSTDYMEGVLEFNLTLLILILSIITLIGWLMFCIITNYIEFYSEKQATFCHSIVLETIWTIVPLLILGALARTSFTLIYSLNDLTTPFTTIKVFAHQWYWIYESHEHDYCREVQRPLKFGAYVITDPGFFKTRIPGRFRLLETDRRLGIPVEEHIKFSITSVDVLHSWAVPSFGVKVDACPGRVNIANVLVKRTGLFYGQCSEICGVNHGFMPIVVLVMKEEEYKKHISEALEKLKVAVENNW